MTLLALVFLNTTSHPKQGSTLDTPDEPLKVKGYKF